MPLEYGMGPIKNPSDKTNVSRPSLSTTWILIKAWFCPLPQFQPTEKTLPIERLYIVDQYREGKCFTPWWKWVGSGNFSKTNIWFPRPLWVAGFQLFSKPPVDRNNGIDYAHRVVRPSPRLGLSSNHIVIVVVLIRLFFFPPFFFPFPIVLYYPGVCKFSFSFIAIFQSAFLNFCVMLYLDLLETCSPSVRLNNLCMLIRDWTVLH